MLIEIVIIAGIIIFDQLIKVAAANVLPALPGHTFVFIPGFASFTYVQNTGAAFILQYLNNVSVDYNAVQVDSDMANRILTYIKRYDPNIRV